MTPNYASICFKVVLGSSLTDGTDISTRLTSLTYKESVKKDDTLEIKASGDDADYLLGLDEFDKGRPITFSFGYIGGPMSIARTLILQDICPTYQADGRVDLTTTTVDKGQSMKKVTSNRVWKNKTTPEIMEEIAKMHGLGIMIETPDSTYNAAKVMAGTQTVKPQDVKAVQAQIGTVISQTPQKTKEEFKEWSTLPQGGKTNMQFLQWLAAKEGKGYNIHVQDGKLHMTKNNQGAAASDKIIVGVTDSLISFAIKYRESTVKNAGEFGTGTGIVNGDNGQSTPELGYVLMQTATGEVTRVARPGVAWGPLRVAPKPAPKPTPKVTLQNKSLGELAELALNPPTNFEDNYVNGGMAPSAGNEPPDLSFNAAKSSWDKARKRILTATMTEWGNPTRKCNTVLTVEGIAKRYQGNWFIESVTHTISSTYITTSEFTKGAVSADAQGTPVKQKNTEPGTEKATGNYVIMVTKDGAVKNADGTTYSEPYYKGHMAGPFVYPQRVEIKAKNPGPKFGLPGIPKK